MRDIVFSTILFFLIGWIFILFVGSMDYGIRRLAVGNITYRYAQTAGKKGEMNDTIYEEMLKKLGNYGSFDIVLKAETFREDGISTKEGKELLNLNLRESGFDILTVTVTAKKEHWLSRALELCPLIRQAASMNVNGHTAVYIQ